MSVQSALHAPTSPPSLYPALVSVLSLWRPVLLLFVAAGGVMGLAINRFTLPRYRMEAQLTVSESVQPLVTDTQPMPRQSVDFIRTQSALLNSPAVLSRLLTMPEIRQFPDLVSSADPIAAAASHISVAVIPDTDVIEVKVTSRNASESTVMGRALVKAYTDFHAQRSHAASAEVVKSLRKEHALQRGEFLARLSDIKNFEQDNGTFFALGTNRDAELPLLVKATERVSNARQKVASASHAESANKNAGSGTNQVAARLEWTNLRELRDQIEGLHAELAAFASTYGAAHPVRLQREAQLNEMKARLVREEGEALRRAGRQSQVSAAQARQASDSASVAQRQEMATAAHRNMLAAEYAVKESALRDAQKTCEVLEQRMMEATLNEHVLMPSICVLNAGSVARDLRPPQEATLAYGMLLGLLVGGVVCGFAEWARPRFHTAAMAGTWLRVTVVGLAPRGRLGRALGFMGGLKHGGLGDSDQAEMARMIRNVLAPVLGDHVQTVTVTSATADESTGAIAAGLARALAETGERVLLVDANLRGVPQAAMDGTEITFAQMLKGTALPQEMLAVTAHGQPKVLRAGLCGTDPAALMTPAKLEQIFREFGRRFDRIVIELPPVMCASESSVAASASDATLLVVNASRSRPRACRRALRLLGACGARVLCAVVENAIDAGVDGRGGGAFVHDYLELQPRSAGFAGHREMVQRRHKALAA
jgi:Mrp family chromosome partitioning ATPase/capsular polysaccharide biosynthesis protein